MKRGIIYNNGHTIVIPNEEIWMTAWEIADLFYVTPISINHVDVYNLEMVIALSFHFDTGHSILFRRWLIRKASTPYRTQIPILIHLPGKEVCSC